MSEYCVVSTTTDRQDHARALAAEILQAGLGACVQIQAIESHYVWQGQQAQTAEWLLSIKTRCALYDELERLICAHHHYETPQVICLPLIAGHPDYLRWVSQNTAASGHSA